MGAGASVDAATELLHDAPLDVVERLQFQDFPDCYLVAVRLALSGGVELTRLFLCTPRGVWEQQLLCPFSEPRLEAVAAVLDEHATAGGGGERRYWCADQSCLWVDAADDGVAQFVVSTRADAALDLEAGAAFGAHTVAAVPDLLDVVAAARRRAPLPPAGGRGAARRPRDWPPSEDDDDDDSADCVATLLLRRRRHRAAHERRTEMEWARRYRRGSDHPIAAQYSSSPVSDSSDSSPLEAVEG